MNTLHPSPDIQLRILTKADAATLFSLVDQNRAYLRRWLGWLDKTKTIADSEGFLKEAEAAAIAKKFFRFGIFYQEILVGIIELQTIDFTNKKAQVGYWLAEDYQGKGIVTLSLKALLDFAFNTLALHRIEIHVATGNKSSANVCKRLGFVQEGTLRENEWLYDHYVDHEVWGLVEESYNQ
ncbi:MAG: GNAT family protein [bacterium]